MERVGFSISAGLRASEIVQAVVHAEALGYESAWVAEGHGGDQFAILSACATATSRIRLGTCISSVFVRSPPTIAMAAATVDELSEGRFVLGLGSSHRVQVGPEHGVDYVKPIERLTETVQFVRTLVANGKASFAGETFSIENFDFWFEPHRRDIPIYLAGLFPKMLHLCGQIADGIILTRVTTERLAEVRRLISAGEVSVGRKQPIEVTSLMVTSVNDDRARAFDAARPGVAMYAGFFPRYNRLIAESGFPEAAAAIKTAWERGDRAAAAAAVPDDVIAQTGVVGTPAECRARLLAYRAAGLDLPIINPIARGPNGLDDVLSAIEACAPK
ncbi:MAG: LLM class flavin-dependent oxidoreductase [Gammaproteobacteria bacterium]|nr:LLM class flavin-dependent oxidoreductase [Gammaproteobacteria bacterium]